MKLSHFTFGKRSVSQKISNSFLHKTWNEMKSQSSSSQISIWLISVKLKWLLTLKFLKCLAALYRTEIEIIRWESVGWDAWIVPKPAANLKSSRSRILFWNLAILHERFQHEFSHSTITWKSINNRFGTIKSYLNTLWNWNMI